MHPVKARWNLAEEIGSILKIDKHIVFKYMGQFKDSIPKIQERNRYHIDKAKAIINEREIWRSNLRWSETESETEIEEEERDVTNELKLALWYINKIGDPKRARKILEAAINALQDI